MIHDPIEQGQDKYNSKLFFFFFYSSKRDKNYNFILMDLEQQKID